MGDKCQNKQGTSSQMTERAKFLFNASIGELRRDPSIKQPVKPKQANSFRTIQEFLQYQSEAYMSAKLASDQSRYITGHFEEKRKVLTVRIDNFLRQLWKEVPPPHLRLEFSNVLNFTITYSELWSWIGETINRDYSMGHKSFLSCDLIQAFTEFFTVIENCQRNTHVETSDFAQLLKLRDTIITCLQNHYRVAWPILHERNGLVKPFPNNSKNHRYCPYDTEWLCGSVISGPNYLSCVKYLCITRLAQLDIACMRADIIAEKEKLEIDFVESIRVPLPVEATNAKMLGNALYNREFRMKENFRRTKQALTATLGCDEDLRFVITTTEFIELRGDIRRKKKNVMDLLVQCERKDFRPFLQIISVMSIVEAQLLILLRVAAQFVDKKLGMYGKTLPVIVHKLCMKLFLTTTLESCRAFPLNSEITALLDMLRNEVRKYARTWYLNYEKNCESVFTERIDVASMEQKYMMCYELSRDDFTEELDSNVDRMLEYLRHEQIEMERLLCQLCQVKRARYYWPKKDVPEFSLNICKGNISAFCSNFDQGMSPEEVESIQRHAEFVLHESTMTTSIGEEILLTAQHIMKETKCVPDCVEINRAFKTHFRERLGEVLIEDKTADELAAQFAEIIIADVDMSNSRLRIHRPGGNPGLCAQRMADEVCKKYLEYVENPMPTLRIPIPMDPPPGEDDSDVEESASEEESDYATDEGEMHPRRQASSDDDTCESPDEDEDSDNNMESANGSENSEEDSEQDSEESSDDSDAFEPTDGALLAAALFSLDAVTNAALMGVASNAMFNQDPMRILLDYDEVPVELIDAFMSRFLGVNRNIVLELLDVD